MWHHQAWGYGDAHKLSRKCINEVLRALVIGVEALSHLPAPAGLISVQTRTCS